MEELVVFTQLHYFLPLILLQSSSSSLMENEGTPSTSTTVTYRVNIFTTDYTAPPAAPADFLRTGDEAFSCLVILLTMCLFTSMTIILGVYGPVELVLGPYTSMLVPASTMFVEYVQVKAFHKDNTYYASPLPTLYGFSQPPQLLPEKATWSQRYQASVPPNSHQEWIYFLDQGSQISISYNITGYTLVVAIARGKDTLIEWIDDPYKSNSAALSLNLIHGIGTIQLKVSVPSDYYIAIANLNPDGVKVQLNWTIEATIYNTAEAYYKCNMNGRERGCSFKLSFLTESVALLTTPGPVNRSESTEWYLNLSYGPRWITYLVGSGVMTVAILVAFKVCNYLLAYCGSWVGRGGRADEARIPLIHGKDDDNLSLGSSYDSVSHDEEEERNKLPLFCATCGAPKDCFFLPCGHSATCFTCGMKVVEEDRTCPICTRETKKVRKILAV